MLGIVLVLIFAIRLALGLTLLPLALRPRDESTVEDDGAWRGTQKLILFVVTLLVLRRSFSSPLQRTFFPFANSNSPSRQIVVCPFRARPIFALRNNRNRDVLGRRRATRDPTFAPLVRSVYLALSPPHSIWNSAHCFLLAPTCMTTSTGERTTMGTLLRRNFGHISPLLISLMLGLYLPRRWRKSFFAGDLTGAIQRYGMWRGLFLVGIVWSALHFYSDFHARMTNSGYSAGVGDARRHLPIVGIRSRMANAALRINLARRDCARFVQHYSLLRFCFSISGRRNNPHFVVGDSRFRSVPLLADSNRSAARGCAADADRSLTIAFRETLAYLFGL